MAYFTYASAVWQMVSLETAAGGRILTRPPNPRSIPSPHDGEVGRGLGRGDFKRARQFDGTNPSPQPSPRSCLAGRGATSAMVGVSRCARDGFKNRRKSRSRRTDAAEVFFAPKSASHSENEMRGNIRPHPGPLPPGEYVFSVFAVLAPPSPPLREERAGERRHIAK
jgi:hypothetical protein